MECMDMTSSNPGSNMLTSVEDVLCVEQSDPKLKKQCSTFLFRFGVAALIYQRNSRNGSLWNRLRSIIIVFRCPSEHGANEGLHPRVIPCGNLELFWTWIRVQRPRKRVRNPSSTGRCITGRNRLLKAWRVRGGYTELDFWLRPWLLSGW